MRHLSVALAIAVVTLLGVFVFPGHTWLQSDTQIYVPMFERLWDSTLYQHELIASRPHLAYTIYDETALLARRLTGLDFEHILLYEQILFRTLAIWGVYLICRRFAESIPVALFTASIVSLGAAIVGPAVLSFEYEPVPRGFAISLLFCAIGFAIHGEIVWSSIAASLAFLYHPPTTVPFFILFGAVVLHTRRWTAVIAPAAAAALLAALAQFQPGVTEQQHFWTRIPPAIEQLQRFRAPYNWVSLWPREFFFHYAVVIVIGSTAFFRVRHKMDAHAQLFLAGLPLLGVLSVAASYALLDGMKLALIPQWQPARAVLFVTVSAVILCAVAAAEAAESRHWLEACLWMLLPFVIPVHQLAWGTYPRAQALTIAALAAMAAASLSIRRFTAVGAAITLLAAMFLIPGYAKVKNYARIHSADLDQLSAWARTSTSKDAVFHFPDPGKDLRPGIFRAKALRAVYVDWKAGGQVNYFDDLGLEWWSRWEQVSIRKELPREIDYIVIMKGVFPPGVSPVFRNAEFSVFRASPAVLACRIPLS